MSHSLGSRKEEELATYEQLYAQGLSTGQTSFRAEFFCDSEKRFKDLILENSNAKKVLEIGCGLGEHSLLAAKVAQEVIGTDISSEGIKLASSLANQQGLAEKVRFEIADAEDLVYSDGSFDVVINHEVFSSIDIAKVISELHRVLSNRGIVICKETLGHNPLFNLKRKIKAKRGGMTQWAANHIWRDGEFSKFENLFTVEIKENYHLLVMFVAILCLIPGEWEKGNRNLLIQFIDRVLLKAPFVKNLAFTDIILKNLTSLFNESSLFHADRL
ncbi:MAG: class I SAM-dependent methyltransferase [Bdellovibrionota bacterium]